MKVKAKRATSYHYGGLRYIWETDGAVIDVPEPLGPYLVNRRDDLFSSAENETEPAEPVVEVERTSPPPKLPTETDDGDTETEG